MEDTIAAIATPAGVGGLAVIRISGPKSSDIAQICTSQSASYEPHKATFTPFLDPRTNEQIDEVIITCFQAPKSFTAEDVVEISCHGGHYIAKRILQTTLDNGARLAEPGEFTKRAFLNGRIDLTQAEAVSDIIASQTETSHQTALQQLQGQLKEKVVQIRQDLIDTVSLLELELDFSEEEIDKTHYNEINEAISEIKSTCEQLVDSYKNGKIYRNGILAAIVGKPNAGKSSILNALLQEERALVSEVPGTTRDTIEESISHNGIEIRLVDTAGLRTSDDTIESMGISRAENVMKQADILLHVIDINEETDPEPFQENGAPVIPIYNKIDLAPDRAKESQYQGVFTSATELTGIAEIGDAVIEKVLGRHHNGAESSDTMVITSERHRKALQSAVESLEKALVSVENEMPSEFIVVDLRDALNSLGKLTGETTTDDILNNIFEKFCIGK